MCERARQSRREGEGIFMRVLSQDRASCVGVAASVSEWQFGHSLPREDSSRKFVSQPENHPAWQEISRMNPDEFPRHLSDCSNVETNMLVSNLDGTTRPLNHKDAKAQSKAGELGSDLCASVPLW